MSLEVKIDEIAMNIRLWLKIGGFDELSVRIPNDT